ncbi:MAG: 5-(carboxyamino)imidazole ribonucleotide synthase [Flavobacteriales bacterium]|nr:5-(carboxyamino)imidazole ribonucleotide synthase [Flavobacteriales bacterium]|tara:strand:+ start:371 stop:1513 length:1143 start_codon:yes stop_codon:yes gene_type:complete
MEKGFSTNIKIGVLGGGQLGRMLQQKALDFGLDLAFIDPDSNAPCKEISSRFFKGDFKDFETVYSFGKTRDILTIEIEHVNVEALKKLENEGVKVFPQPNIIKTIQDKGLQKVFYKKNNIPTSDFYLIEGKEEILAFEDEFPFMQKMRKGGYDGQGVTPIRSKEDLAKAFEVPSVLEKMVDFEKELSVIVSRNENGEVKSFPCVECEFNPEANLVEFLFSPATISNEIEEKAQKIARSVIEKLEMVGILAVELFLTKDGEVLVNEIAPRPHNSGHQTIEGNYESQYGQLLRCLLNLPLGNTAIKRPSVMVNLLGEKGYMGKAIYDGIEKALAHPGVNLHLYGKTQTKPFRKMGHATIVNDSLNEAKTIAKKVQEDLKIIA